MIASIDLNGKDCLMRYDVADLKLSPKGKKRTLWVDAKVNENPQVMRDVKEKFLKYYSINEGNYPVPDSYAPHPYVIALDATT